MHFLSWGPAGPVQFSSCVVLPMDGSVRNSKITRETVANGLEPALLSVPPKEEI